ncbi:hypothetical protein BX616_006591 [Lobosporangium transversale]|uniref:Phosphatidic acid phosphatase type 2/haloperoxidase domain-containing protein n=1 Tax=Lobosporangium transversale TaxID=64571 RepID=A0A1Y2H2H1_9FUNG|nr:hypothetical protein BCR41DRAFT_366486 [Lobosporangium transversale]KAF9918704.1 hypothetical protein BX616_006591 [Lobosporangium transversale]ORZ28757.1 hypothetical protein BCR41DRAFT_366486 [Lobosporangium transversale]|eukprot:XP_021886430.1 hypothetical protein BCR41DRAFT_366486 [Lobosporangium transversale]
MLAKCLKHIIRQPRPERPNLDEGVDMDSQPSFTSPSSSSSSSSTSALHTSGVTFESITSASGFVSSNTSSFSDTQSTRAHTKEVDMNSISTISSSSLSLAPTTSLQQEQANSSNELKTKLTSQKIRRQRRRKIYNFRPDYGMPSSHAQLVAFFVCYISLQLVLMEPEGSPGQWFLILLLQLYAWSVVWSRIQVGHHTVSQVLVGAIIGAIYGMVWFAIWIWKVEDMIKHWQWMDRYGVIQVRKMWRQLEMDEAVAVGRAGGRMYLREDHFPQHGHFLRL